MPEAIITIVHYTEGGFEKSFVKRAEGCRNGEIARSRGKGKLTTARISAAGGLSDCFTDRAAPTFPLRIGSPTQVRGKTRHAKR